MFNVGPLELMVLLVLALIVFGPEKLPELMASAGRMIREFQRASGELTQVFQETQQEFTSTLQDTQREFTSTLDETKAELTSAFDFSTAMAADPAPQPVVQPETAEQLSFPTNPSDTAVPDELDTAAGMVDPVAPFESPARSSTAEAETVTPAPRPRRSRRKAAELAGGTAALTGTEPAIEAVDPSADTPYLDTDAGGASEPAEPPARAARRRRAMAAVEANGLAAAANELVPRAALNGASDDAREGASRPARRQRGATATVGLDDPG